jgi:hypothetical protein
MSHNDIVELELNIKELNDMVDLAKALGRLEKNRDFKKLVVDQYLSAEAVRLVHAKADGNTQSPQVQERILRDIDAIGSFTQFLNEIGRKAEMAKEAIAESEADIDAIRRDGDDA